VAGCGRIADVAAGSEPDFDLLAASLRADTTDLVAYVEALAVKLEGALPGRTRVARTGGGLFGRGEKHVERVEVDLGEGRYLLDQRGRRGAPQVARQKVVRGIALSTDAMHLQDWIDALARDLAVQAQAGTEGRQAIERLIG
jgi:hypothetical protein